MGAYAVSDMHGCADVYHRIKKIIKPEDTVYCLGEIVHNKQVIEDLEKQGMITVEDLNNVPENSIVIFRAHGEPEYKYEIAKNRVY